MLGIMTKLAHRIYITLFIIVAISAVALLIINGFDYYSLSSLDKPFSSKYPLLKPSGLLGHGFGIVGTLMMIIGVFSYMLRKRWKPLFGWGFLSYWLEFHVFMCVMGPILVLFHTDFKFGGIVSVSFWSMVAVVLSGVAGRYIYTQIPRSIAGNELSMQEIDDLNSELSNRLKIEAQLSPAIMGKINAFVEESNRFSNFSFIDGIKSLMSIYVSLPLDMKRLGRELAALQVDPVAVKKMVLPLVKAKVVLIRRIGLLRTMQKLFRYWHIFHLPFAITMFIIMLIHVIVTITFGYRWIF